MFANIAVVSVLLKWLVQSGQLSMPLLAVSSEPLKVTPNLV